MDPDLYDSDDVQDYYDDDDDDDHEYEEDDDYDDVVCHSTSNSKNVYTVLKEADIRKRQEEDILHVSGTLSVPEVTASKLLYHYKWNVSQLHDEWFADEGEVRDRVGLPSFRVELSATNEGATCGICFDILPLADFYPMICGHLYCKTCWKGYMKTAIQDGPGCLSLRCPKPSCRVAVCCDMIEELATEEERKKYSYFFMRSYVEESKKMKWCPAPGCENAVELEVGDEIFDVTCLCSATFCWNCGEDAHRPVDCETVSKWVLKNSSESENTEWILANSKICPKCKRNIEKNHGCMHMKCTAPCKFEFCWLCLGDWKEHDQKTGGFYACNRYESEKAKGVYDEEEKIRERAKNSLSKYTHYYERWASNQKSRRKAIEVLHEVQTVTLGKLSNKTKETETQLNFITDAWRQIIECRRVLQWTYAYGHYLPEDEHVKKQLFEYTQGEAEAGLERLHKCAEKELDVFLEGDADEWVDEKEFNKYHQKLVNLTAVTQSYFTNLVTSMETEKL
ncbi:hypothetical protein BVRB_5g119640 [Beta vulgaris subsp. vulgaris]|nr:hypothetical protein BVRB_5g119640 [Beta vulgaris subsp. vulgaris]